jgi:hypothetical protein
MFYLKSDSCCVDPSTTRCGMIAARVGSLHLRSLQQALKISIRTVAG